MRRRTHVLSVVLLAAVGCTGSDDDDDSAGCRDGIVGDGVTGSFQMTATHAVTGAVSVDYGCAVIGEIVSDVYATFSAEGGDGSLLSGDAADIFVPGATGTYVATSGGFLGFAYLGIEVTPSAVIATPREPERCFDAGVVTGTNNGSVTFTNATATTVAGTFDFPALCFDDVDYFTDVSGTFSIP